MKPHEKLTHSTQQENQVAARQHETVSEGPREFADPDEALRFDAAQTVVPPKVEVRLQKSLRPDKESWLKRWFGL